MDSPYTSLSTLSVPVTHANASLLARSADRAGADADLDNVGAGQDELLDHLLGDNVSSHDGVAGKLGANLHTTSNGEDGELCDSETGCNGPCHTDISVISPCQAETWGRGTITTYALHKLNKVLRVAVGHVQTDELNVGARCHCLLEPPEVLLAGTRRGAHALAHLRGRVGGGRIK